MGVRQEAPRVVKSSIRASAKAPSRFADELIGTALHAPLPGIASRFLERVQPSQRARQNHLKRYQGRIALVGSFSELNNAKDAQKVAARSAKILCGNEVVVPGRMTGLRIMMPFTLTPEWLEGADYEWLKDSAGMLKRAIAKECDVVASESSSPMVVPPNVTFRHPEAAYDTLSAGLNDLEAHARQASPTHAYTDPSLVVIADANYAAYIFPGIPKDRLTNGGVMGVARVGRRAEHNLWVPLGLRGDGEQESKPQSNLGG